MSEKGSPEQQTHISFPGANVRSRAGQLISHESVHLEAFRSPAGTDWWTVWLVFSGMDGSKTECLEIGDVMLNAGTVDSGQPQSAVKHYTGNGQSGVHVSQCSFNLSFSEHGRTKDILQASGEIALNLKFCDQTLDIIPSQTAAAAQSEFMGELADVFGFRINAVSEDESQHDLRLDVQNSAMHAATSYSLGPVFLDSRFWQKPQVGSRFSMSMQAADSGLTQCDFSLWFAEHKGIVTVAGDLRPRWVIGSLDLILDGVRDDDLRKHLHTRSPQKTLAPEHTINRRK